MRGLFIGIATVVLLLVGFGLMRMTMLEAPLSGPVTGMPAPKTQLPRVKRPVTASTTRTSRDADRRSDGKEGAFGRDEPDDLPKMPPRSGEMVDKLEDSGADKTIRSNENRGSLTGVIGGKDAPGAAQPEEPDFRRRAKASKKKPLARPKPLAPPAMRAPEPPPPPAPVMADAKVANQRVDGLLADDFDGDEEKIVEVEEEEEVAKEIEQPRKAEERAEKKEKRKRSASRLRERALRPPNPDMAQLDLIIEDERRAKGEEGKFGYFAAKPLPNTLDLSLLSGSKSATTPQSTRPEKFLPRMCYFENTYLGGNAAYQEQLRRVHNAMGHTRPLKLARLDDQAFDPPADAGMALTASLDATGLQQPGRVVLQVGLQGSQRYGWRRPPLDVVLVVDAPAAHATRQAVDALIDALGPRDRLGVIRAAESSVLAPVAGVRATRDALLDLPAYSGSASPRALMQAMDRAGGLLRSAAGESARIPGSQTVILLTQGRRPHARAAAQAAHRLQTQGAVVSVVDLAADANAEWWAVANAGHGNFHQTTPGQLPAAVDAELASLSKVVARLLRLNVRLGPQSEGIRVIGSRVLAQEEVKAVKAREEATDRNLSKTMGLKADRGADDDGIQTVIPYFYGGDSHVVLIELWVDPAKASPDTAIAEISLKYKDMVNLSNATARTAVFLGRRPRTLTWAQRQVKQNLAGFAFADALNQAASHMANGDRSSMVQTLRNHANTARDRQVAQAFARLQHADVRAVSQALRLASQRRKGVSAEAP